MSHNLPFSAARLATEVRFARGTDFSAPSSARPFLLLHFFLCVFGPKLACQAPKPLKSNKQKEIEVDIELGSNCYTEYIDKTREPRREKDSRRGFTYLE
jgi:hypothetical protein